MEKKESDFFDRIKRINKKDYKFFAVVGVVTVVAVSVVVNDLFHATIETAENFEKSIVNNEDFKSMKHLAEELSQYTGIDPSRFSESSPDRIYEINGTAEFERLIYGNMYTMSLDGETTKVKLIGVDVPEDVTPSEYSSGDSKETISAIIKNKLSDTDVLFYETDETLVDENGSTLVYIYFSDGTMLQEWLLDKGYAQVTNSGANTKYTSRLLNHQEQAQINKAGLWNGYFKE